MVHSLDNYVSYINFSKKHKAFLSTISSIDEPKYYKQTAQKSEWRKVMQKRNKTP